MINNLAQPLIANNQGSTYIHYDWYPAPLPNNAVFEEMSYPDTSYSFSTFFSNKPEAFRLGYASGNYGHGIFTTGVNGAITIGKFVVLQCTRIVSNLSVIIKDHCMFSWGSVITDSWITPVTINPGVRRKMLNTLANSPNRHLEFTDPKKVIVEENVWVGFEAIILPGVTIGRGAVVGCKAVVATDVPPYAVVAGNPARIIKFLDPTDTEEAKIEAFRQFNIQIPR